MKLEKIDRIFVKNIIFLPVPDKEWGQRIVGLIRWEPKQEDNLINHKVLDKLIKKWPSQERPIKWFSCPELTLNSNNKIDRSRWKIWLKNNHN